jgi:hypothetical protein
MLINLEFSVDLRLFILFYQTVPGIQDRNMSQVIRADYVDQGFI